MHRSRVRTSGQIDLDIHDRVNYAVQKSRVEMSGEGHRIELVLEIDTSYATVMEYFASLIAASIGG